jgi:ubiquinone biosynthesis accessory factor UbiK
MTDKNFFEDIAQKLANELPPSLSELDKEIQQKFKGLLQAAFNKLDLVTREEFDVQVKVLAKTREKVDILEEKLELLSTTEK